MIDYGQRRKHEEKTMNNYFKIIDWAPAVFAALLGIGYLAMFALTVYCWITGDRSILPEYITGMPN